MAVATDPLEHFFAEVRRLFGFLENEYRCVRLPEGTDPRGYAGWVTYLNTTTKVEIQYEFGSSPWVVVTPSHDLPGVPSEEARVSLEFMIAHEGGHEVAPVPPPTQTSIGAITAMLQEKAFWLRRVGDDFLNGRFERLPEIARKQRTARLLDAQDS